jgi:hypothetical protein
MKLTELKEKMGNLERVLERDAAAVHSGLPESVLSAGLTGTKEEDARVYSHMAEGQGSVPEDERDLRPTDLAVLDAAYEDEADDDTYDLGFRLGKLRMTDRIGGLVRPKLVEEVRSSYIAVLRDAASREHRPDS